MNSRIKPMICAALLAAMLFGLPAARLSAGALTTDSDNSGIFPPEENAALENVVNFRELLDATVYGAPIEAPDIFAAPEAMESAGEDVAMLMQDSAARPHQCKFSRDPLLLHGNGDCM